MIAGLEKVTAGRVWIGDDGDHRYSTRPTATSRWCFRAMRSTRTRPCARTSPSASAGARSQSRKIIERVDRMAAMLGLGELMERKPAALSGGQRQRVAMGQALVREPRAFLMDEPLSNLDAKLRTSMRGELARLHERLPTTTVYVTPTRSRRP